MGKGYQNFLRAGIFRYEYNFEELEHKVVSSYMRDKNEQWESVAIEIGHLKVEYGEKGKKRHRGEIEGSIVGEESCSLDTKDRRKVNSNILLSTAAK
ncbi:hypothetical protein Golob_014943, partial [Gossypium lobatum]|nr:hypothetical protein [Gossypium lobatum]